MTKPIHVLFVAPPADGQAMAMVRKRPNITVETVSNAVDAHDRLHAADCIVCTPEIPDTDVIPFLEEIRHTQSPLPCLLFSDTANSVFEDVLDQNLAGWISKAGGGKALVNRIEQAAECVRHERRLTAIHASIETLANAETEDEVAETAVTVASSVLDYTAAVVARYDSEAGALRPVAWEGVEEPDADLFDTERGLGWIAFLEGEIQWENKDNETATQQWLAIPLGRHGVLTVLWESESELKSAGRTALIETFASSVKSAFTRLDREWELSAQEARLANSKVTLEQTERRESVVRDVLHALVNSDTRSDIEQAVCKRLTNADPYRFAWVGEYDTTTDELSAQTWIGDEQAFLNELSENANNGETETTARRAVRTKESVKDDDLLGNPPYESWRQEALKRGYRAAVSIPIIYRESIYGVLTVYSGEPNTFDEMEQSLLEDVGTAIAYAINAVESKKALVSNSAVELEFRVCDPQFTVIKFVQMVDCRFEFESVIRETDDTLRLFFTTEGTTPEAVLSFSEQSLVVNDIRHITGSDERDLFECTISGSNVISLLLDHDAIPKAATAEGKEARLTVELPQTADVRRFVETFQSRYGNTELVARRKRNRPVQTEQDFRAQLRHRLTDRQSEALETAYWSGFFEWPRESNGQEIAESMDVSQPTFNRHLRAAERNLLTALFEDE